MEAASLKAASGGGGSELEGSKIITINNIFMKDCPLSKGLSAGFYEDCPEKLRC